MKLKNAIYKRIEYFTPKSYKERMRREMVYAGLSEKVTDKFIGFAILFTIFIVFTVSFVLWLVELSWLGIAIGAICGVIFFSVINVLVILIADSRTAQIELVLPDALQLMSANVRAGMTVDRAIWLSAIPEFGILEEEIRRVGSRTIGGESIKEALTEMGRRIKSNILDRAIKLIIEGIESGGELAKLLEEISLNIRTSQSLKKEIEASVMMYVMFIIFAAVIGAPLLYGISLYFVETMSRLWGSQFLTMPQNVPQGFGTTGLAAQVSAPQISPTELLYFAIASMLITTFFGAIIIGLIRYGEEKKGFKYIPLLVTGALGVFFIVRFVVDLLFGKLFVL